MNDAAAASDVPDIHDVMTDDEERERELYDSERGFDAPNTYEEDIDPEVLKRVQDAAAQREWQTRGNMLEFLTRALPLMKWKVHKDAMENALYNLVMNTVGAPTDGTDNGPSEKAGTPDTVPS